MSGCLQFRAIPEHGASNVWVCAIPFLQHFSDPDTLRKHLQFAVCRPGGLSRAELTALELREQWR